jgi:hypothetical protein
MNWRNLPEPAALSECPGKEASDLYTRISIILPKQAEQHRGRPTEQPHFIPQGSRASKSGIIEKGIGNIYLSGAA